MDDREIILLYLARDESAIAETGRKYGGYCHAIAYRILQSHADAEEIVNDTYLKTWNTIPPAEPTALSSYVGMLCRGLSLNRYRADHAKRRGGYSIDVALEELEACLSEEVDFPDEIALRDALNRFLASLPQQTRIIFLRRYWYFCPIEEIARSLSMGESSVKMQLLRTRNKLKTYLKKEGFDV